MINLCLLAATLLALSIVQAAPSFQPPHLDSNGKLDVETFHKYVNSRRAQENQKHKLIYEIIRANERHHIPTPPPVTIVTELLVPLCNKDNGYKSYYYTLFKMPRNSLRYRYKLVAAYLALYKAPADIGDITIRIMDMSRSRQHDIIVNTTGRTYGELVQIDVSALFTRRRKRWLELDIEVTDQYGRRIDDLVSLPKECGSQDSYESSREPTIDLTFTRREL